MKACRVKVIKSSLRILAPVAIAWSVGAACASATWPSIPNAQRRVAAAHALDPLSLEELDAVRRLVLGHPKIDEGARFPLVEALEPRKDAASHTTQRYARAVVLDAPHNQSFEVVVDLNKAAIVAFEALKNVQPSMLFEEFDEPQNVITKDPRYVAALQRRGIEDPSKVQLDVWAPGVVPTEFASHRMARALSFYRGDSGNPYARPIEGLVVLFDLTTRQVVDVVDHGALPLPPDTEELGEKPERRREAAKPLLVVQPEGPSFSLSGYEVTWQRWNFRFSMHPREGLVLHLVHYLDGAERRSVLHRASLSEMVVPYGDPQGTWAWRNAFDEGEYGLGRMANSLEAGTDVPENAVLIDAAFADDRGHGYVQQRAIALYERNGGMLWTHYDEKSGVKETRRARQLVIGFVVTIGNYDYGFRYVFGQDGSLAFESDLSGIMLPRGVGELACKACVGLKNPSSPAKDLGVEKFGHVVGRGIVAPNHQHFFNMRLDFDIDGTGNSLAELNTRALPMDDANPNGNAFVMEEQVLHNEQQAQRDLNLATYRLWRVYNPQRENHLGHLSGYALLPGHNTVPYHDPNAPIAKRATFTAHHVWGTRYKNHERYGAGEFPNQSLGGEGLAQFVADDESLISQDLVLWYTFGVTHLPRAEEWPVMPAAHVGFRLVPMGFFGSNPALDVPKTKTRAWR